MSEKKEHEGVSPLPMVQRSRQPAGAAPTPGYAPSPEAAQEAALQQSRARRDMELRIGEDQIRTQRKALKPEEMEKALEAGKVVVLERYGVEADGDAVFKQPDPDKPVDPPYLDPLNIPGFDDADEPASDVEHAVAKHRTLRRKQREPADTKFGKPVDPDAN
jgi:hypothetical protein